MRYSRHDDRGPRAMLSFFVSTIAFFVAGYFIRRYMDDIGIPKSMTRGTVVFVAALIIAYGIAYLIDLVVG
jgi:hypothetical protein